MDLNQLTERQQEIYLFIRCRVENHGYGPTVREIGNDFNIKSPNGVLCHLRELELKGLIKRGGFSARALQLINQLNNPGELERENQELRQEVAALKANAEVRETLIADLMERKRCP